MIDQVKPIGKYVLAEKIKDDFFSEWVTEKGIYINYALTEESPGSRNVVWCRVIAVPSGCSSSDEICRIPDHILDQIKVGSIIITSKFSGSTFVFVDKVYVLVPYDEIYAVMPESVLEAMESLKKSYKTGYTSTTEL